VPLEQLDDYYDEDRRTYSRQFREKLGPASHRILVDPQLPSSYGMRARQFPGHETAVTPPRVSPARFLRDTIS